MIGTYLWTFNDFLSPWYFLTTTPIHLWQATPKGFARPLGSEGCGVSMKRKLIERHSSSHPPESNNEWLRMPSLELINWWRKLKPMTSLWTSLQLNQAIQKLRISWAEHSRYSTWKAISWTINLSCRWWLSMWGTYAFSCPSFTVNDWVFLGVYKGQYVFRASFHTQKIRTLRCV